MQSPPPLPEPIWSSIPPDAREALVVAFAFYRNCIERLEAQVRELQARLDRNSTNFPQTAFVRSARLQTRSDEAAFR